MGFFGRHNITTRADKISEFTVNTAEYGTAVPEVLGTTRLSGNVIYYDDFTAHEHKETHKSGKGGGSKSTSITYTYTVACILGLCEGEIAGIGKVWRGKEVYTYPNEKIELTAFLGTQTQKPWAYVVGNHPEKAMPYKGLAYMAGVVDMGDSASLPQYNFEIRGKLLNTGDGVDVNPADYIRYVLDKVGLESVEIEGLDNYRTYCREADLLISSPPDSKPAQAQNIVNEIAKLTNAYFFWSNDRFKIVPLETRNIGSWKADTTIKYDLTSDDFSKQSKGAMVTYSRKDSSEVYNSFPVEFINRNDAYEKETVNYQLSEDIRQNGLRQASSTAAHYFYTKERAVKVAEMLAKKSVNEKNTYTFVLNWAFALLEPGDIVTLTDKNIGIDHLPVRIVTTTENEKGKITCTAVAVENVSGVAQYDIHGSDRPYVNFNIIPPNTIPCIIQPPADLTVDGLELWIGGRGADDGWGGCTVYISDDNINYRTVGQINNSARTGALQADMTADATSCIVSCNDVLLSGTQQDAERGNTLIWIGGECLSYTTATMLQDGNYRLDGLIRGQYNTTAMAHAAGEQFARLDGTLLRESFRKEDVGKKIWLKFCSYNIFGAKEQSLADVQPYQYTLQAYYVPPVLNVTARNRYRQIQDSVARYDIVVSWTPPNLQSYLEGQVWYKTDHGQTVNINNVAGIPVSQLGFQGDWIFGGSGKNQVVIPQAVVGDTYEIAVTTVDKWAASTDPDLAPKVRITVAMKTMVPNTPDGFTLAFGKTATAAWNEVTNTDVMYYEIRRDNAPGAETAGLLARTNGTSANVALNARTGRLYLFARNALGKYSVPAVLSYNKPAPGKPDAPMVKNTMTGFTVAGQGIPADAIGMMVYINDGDAVKTENPVMSYNCEPGIYDVAIAYYDMFGAGERSATARTVVKIIIDETNIKDMAISLQKVDKNLQQVFNTTIPAIESNVSDIQNTTIPAIESNVSKIQDTTIPSIESDITTLQNGITENTNSITAIEKDVSGNATAINQNATDITSLAKAVNGNTTAIHQNADSITSLSETVNGNTSAIAQNSDSITALVKDGKGYASAIAQNTDSINTLVQDGKGYASAIAQNTDSINTLVQDGKGYASAIAQNTDSINTLVQDGKGYASAIAQNTDSINTLVEDGKGYASAIAQNSTSITSVVTNLGDSAKAKEAYSAIAQMQDDIALRVKSGEIISQINLSKEGVQIDGKLLHVTGDTLFDKNVVVKDMIQAGAVTADKMAVDSLSAITANVGSLKGGTITGTQIVGTNFRNTSGSFTVDDSGNIKGVNISSGSVNADIIRKAGFSVSATAKISGYIASTNFTIPLPSGYNENECVWGCHDARVINPSMTYVAMSGRNVKAWSNNERDIKIYYWCLGVK